MTTRNIRAHEAREGMRSPASGLIVKILTVQYLGAPAFRITYERGHEKLLLPHEELTIVVEDEQPAPEPTVPGDDDLIMVHDNVSGKPVNFAKFVQGATYVVTPSSIREILIAMATAYPTRYTVRLIDHTTYSPEIFIERWS